ncbi:hypothetical protein LXL04_038641 [Taraxacum kok-saghyz]
MEKLPDERWKTVRRRHYQSKQPTEAVSTFFVSNTSKETTKGEMKKVFAKFGKLIDVYMGTKVGRNGQHYAFIRFIGVEDVGELERRMNDTNIRGRKVEVNITKHERKAPPPPPLLNTTRNMKPVPSPNPNQCRQGNSTLRDHRTFAQVMNSKHTQTQNHDIPMRHVPPPPLPQSRYRWKKKHGIGCGKRHL